MVRMRPLLRANLDRQGTWLSATGVVNGRVPGSAEASMAEVSEPGLLLTLRWRDCVAVGNTSRAIPRPRVRNRHTSAIPDRPVGFSHIRGQGGAGDQHRALDMAVSRCPAQSVARSAALTYPR